MGVMRRYILMVICDYMQSIGPHFCYTTTELKEYVNEVMGMSFSYRQIYATLYYYTFTSTPIFQYNKIARHAYWKLR